MECQVEFLQKDEFNPRYFRNNRSRGTKNLRCFPVCKANHHVEKQFCGQAISVRIIIKSPPGSHTVDFKAIRIFGEFNSVPDLRSEASLSEYKFMDCNPFRERSPKEMIAETYVGSISAVDSFERLEDASVVTSCTAILNSSCYSWSYAWVGSRYSTKTRHVFSVSVYVPVSADLSQGFVRVALAHSPPFCVQSMRRRGAREEHEAEKGLTTAPATGRAHSVSDDDESDENACLTSLGKRQPDEAASPKVGSFICLPGKAKVARVLLHSGEGDLLVKYQDSKTFEVIKKDQPLLHYSSSSAFNVIEPI